MLKNSLVALFATFLFTLTPAQLASANGPLHTVRPGDTLTAIASAYGVSADQLAAVNGMPQDGWLQPGQQLTIPAQPPMPYGAPPAAAYSGFGSPMPYPPDQYFQPAQSQFAAPVQQMPAPTWTRVEPQPAPGNFAPYAPAPMWDQLAQYPPADFFPQVADSAPYFAPQPVQPAYQPVVAYQSNQANQAYPTYQAYQPYPPGPNWQPASNFGPAFPPGQNPALFTPNGEKWIDINLSTQTLTALEGQTPIYRALVSTGVWDTPTVVGTYNIYVKYEKADMSGGSGVSAYNLKDVPYVMYFHGDYGIHGTYWHTNFGQPMSHGCVNLHTLDAQWLFNWAPVGTKVVTHY